MHVQLRPRSHRLPAVALLAAALFAGCESSTTAILGGVSNNGNSGGTSDKGFHMNATIDGTPWSSDSALVAAGAAEALAGTYTIYGADLPGTNVTLSLANIRGPATYPLGVGPSVPGGSVILATATGGWATAQSGADGSITITKLSSSEIAGTFSFVVNASTGAASGAKTVSAGDFDMPVKQIGTIGAVPDNAGGAISATIASAAWNASTVTASVTSPGGSGAPNLVVAGTNNLRAFGITLTGVSGPGTYATSTAAGALREIHVSNVVNAASNSWSSIGSGGSGTVIITSMTATRVAGTFSAVLVPAAGSSTTGTLVVTNGTFDVGLP